MGTSALFYRRTIARLAGSFGRARRGHRRALSPSLAPSDDRRNGLFLGQDDRAVVLRRAARARPASGSRTQGPQARRYPPERVAGGRRRDSKAARRSSELDLSTP